VKEAYPDDRMTVSEDRLRTGVWYICAEYVDDAPVDWLEKAEEK